MKATRLLRHSWPPLSPSNVQTRIDSLLISQLSSSWVISWLLIDPLELVHQTQWSKNISSDVSHQRTKKRTSPYGRVYTILYIYIYYYYALRSHRSNTSWAFSSHPQPFTVDTLSVTLNLMPDTPVEACWEFSKQVHAAVWEPIVLTVIVQWKGQHDFLLSDCRLSSDWLAMKVYTERYP